jgi:hypothetical protein
MTKLEAEHESPIGRVLRSHRESAERRLHKASECGGQVLRRLSHLQHAQKLDRGEVLAPPHQCGGFEGQPVLEAPFSHIKVDDVSGLTRFGNLVR